VLKFGRCGEWTRNIWKFLKYGTGEDGENQLEGEHEK
jgi:hypothetical protein